MPIAFFKCECGIETRKLVPLDHSHDTYDENRRRWYFDPSKDPGRLDLYPNFVVCDCGRSVKQTVDPKGIPTKLLFNYMAEDM